MAHREVEAGLAPHEPADPAKSQDEEVSVRCEFDLQVGKVVGRARAGEEQLDDLVFPQPIGPADGRGRRRIAEPGRLDREREAVTPPCQHQLDDLVGTGRHTVPGRSDAKGYVHAQGHYRPSACIMRLSSIGAWTCVPE